MVMVKAVLLATVLEFTVVPTSEDDVSHYSNFLNSIDPLPEQMRDCLILSGATRPSVVRRRY